MGKVVDRFLITAAAYRDDFGEWPTHARFSRVSYWAFRGSFRAPDWERVLAKVTVVPDEVVEVKLLTVWGPNGREIDYWQDAGVRWKIPGYRRPEHNAALWLGVAPIPFMD